nr:hypothetical protein [Tanacetum cinerariifolium]
MDNPGKAHWKAVKWILRYLKGALNICLVYDGKGHGDGLVGYADSDYSDDLSLGLKVEKPALFCDRQSALSLAKNLIYHERTKHIDVMLNFIRDVLDEDKFSIQKIVTEHNPADMLTKALPTEKFEHCLNLVNIHRRESPFGASGAGRRRLREILRNLWRMEADMVCAGVKKVLVTTWVLVTRPANVNVVRSMWLFKHKFNADGSLSIYKVRLVANGHSQQQGIDCDETFSLVIKPAIIRTVLSLAVSHDWPIHQLDVKNAFLYGHLSETVYMHQPLGFVDPNKPDYVCHLQSEFAMTDLGSLNYFFGISAQRSTSGLFLSQSKFAEEILERAHMQNCNPCWTLVDTKSKLGSDGDPVSDRTLYRSLVGALQYLTFTRSDLSYTVYQLHVSSTTQLSAYTDADWDGCPVTRRFTSGYCMFLGNNLLSWFVTRQVTLSRSSAEAEYRGVANVVAEIAWICNLLCELHTPLFTATLVYCDNALDDDANKEEPVRRGPEAGAPGSTLRRSSQNTISV